jgi:hypothetical protein
VSLGGALAAGKGAQGRRGAGHGYLVAGCGGSLQGCCGKKVEAPSVGTGISRQVRRAKSTKRGQLARLPPQEVQGGRCELTARLLRNQSAPFCRASQSSICNLAPALKHKWARRRFSTNSWHCINRGDYKTAALLS